MKSFTPDIDSSFKMLHKNYKLLAYRLNKNQFTRLKKKLKPLTSASSLSADNESLVVEYSEYSKNDNVRYQSASTL